MRRKHPSPSSSTRSLLPINIHTPRPDVSHLSVLPFSFHPASQRPVSAEDKSQGCGLSTRTQIKITIFYPSMTVSPRSVFHRRARGVFGPEAGLCGPPFAVLQTEPGLPHHTWRQPSSPNVALRTKVSRTRSLEGRELGTWSQSISMQAALCDPGQNTQPFCTRLFS